MVRLAEAIEEIKRDKREGFEDLFFLTYKEIYQELADTAEYRSWIWEIIEETYTHAWKKRAELPEGDVILWLKELSKIAAEKVLAENKDKKKTAQTEGYNTEKKAETVLISIEDSLGFFDLDYVDGTPDGRAVSRMKKPSSKIVLYLLCIGILLGIAGVLGYSVMESAKNSSLLVESSEHIQETTSAYGVIVETTAENAENVDRASFGWNKYAKGWKYKKVDGRFVLENWLFDEAKLYYFNELGYMVTGTVQLGSQTFEFAESGELLSIHRFVYDIEQNKTDLGRQLDQQGMSDLKTYIVNDSIVNEDGWIYYLSKEREDGLPKFYRLKDGSGKLEEISDMVSGYVVVEDTAWYYKEDKLLYFVTSNTAEIAGENAIVTDKDGRYILTDASGKPVSSKESESIQIGPRIYNLKNGAIISVDRIPTTIGAYNFMRSDADKDNNIYTEDGKKFLTQGFWITDMCVVGNSLYYSTIIKFEGDQPISQLYRMDVNTKDREAITGLFEGRAEKMYYYPENAAIFIEFSPIGEANTYGRVMMYNLNEGKLYLINDEAEREQKGASAMSRIRVITTDRKKLYCYIEEGSYNSQKKDMDVTGMNTVILSIENKVEVGIK